MINEENTTDDQEQLSQGDIPMSQDTEIDAGVAVGIGSSLIQIEGEPLILRVFSVLALTLK